MKHILCFGDSNTYGTNPSGGRWPLEVRWTGVAQELLGKEYRIIEEGCGGRTTVWEDNLELHKCGRPAFHVAMATHMPLDLVIIMLGTNDLKSRFSALPFDVANGAGELVKIAQDFKHTHGYPAPKVLLISPIHMGKDVEKTGCFGMNQESIQKSFLLAEEFKKVSQKLNCDFLDASQYAKPSNIDNLHIDKEGHSSLADAIANKVREILK